ncbi:UNVERIFIED_CONTAM: hypothetical protein RMT77_003899 [Armadillidium vulgare]
MSFPLFEKLQSDLSRVDVNNLNREVKNLTQELKNGRLRDHPSKIYIRLIRRIDFLKDKASDLFKQKGNFEIENNIKELLIK